MSYIDGFVIPVATARKAAFRPCQEERRGYSSNTAHSASSNRMGMLTRTDPRFSMEHNPPPFDGKRMIFGGFEPIVEAGDYRRDGYVQGFVLPAHDREGYRKMAAEAWPIFADYGALQVVEAWQEDVPEGRQTDFFRTVKTQPEEQVAFSWMLWPSRKVCDAAGEKMQSGERMQEPPANGMPFNPQRMIYAGFLPVVELGE